MTHRAFYTGPLVWLSDDGKDREVGCTWCDWTERCPGGLYRPARIKFRGHLAADHPEWVKQTKDAAA